MLAQALPDAHDSTDKQYRKPRRHMTDKREKPKMGRPVKYTGKNIERTFLLSEVADDVIEEVVQELGCSRSDALEHILRNAPGKHKRAEALDHALGSTPSKRKRSR